MTRYCHDRGAEGRELWITGAAMRVGDFRADVVSQWVGECFDGELHAKRIASLSDGVLGVLHSASLAVSAIGLALAQARGLKAKHAAKQGRPPAEQPGRRSRPPIHATIRQAIATNGKSSWRWIGRISTPTINRP
jgi:hypothetical protein